MFPFTNQPVFAIKVSAIVGIIGCRTKNTNTGGWIAFVNVIVESPLATGRTPELITLLLNKISIHCKLF